MPVTTPPSRTINNALDYGMRNDGVTDNTPLMKTAIATLVQRGENSMFIPPVGAFNFKLGTSVTPVVLPANFVLWGVAGLGSTLLVDPSSWSGVSAGTGLVMMEYSNGCAVSGLLFDGQKSLTNSGNPTTFGLCFLNRSAETNSDNLFEDLIFQNQLAGPSLEQFCIASGYLSARQKYVRITCQNGNGTGISINGNMLNEVATPGSGLANDIDILDCRGTNMLWQGMTLYGARNIRVRNFVGYGCGSSAVFGGAGINCEWVSDIDILGCRSEMSMGPGINFFGWAEKIRIRDCLLQNNNQLDYNNFGEISCRRGTWYTSSFTPASARTVLQGVTQDLTLTNNKVIPKTTGTYGYHLHVEADPFVSWPATTATQATAINVEQQDISTWRFNAQGPDVYCYQNANNGGSWEPGASITLNSTRNNGGYLLTCTAAGTTATYGNLGPQPTSVGQTGITDGGVTWTATSLSVDANNMGSFWAASTPYAVNDVRSNNAYAYRATAGTSGSGNGPHGTTLGGTETDGGITWTCLGLVTTSAQVAGSNVAKPPDFFVPSMAVANISALPSASNSIDLWTGANITATSYTGGGALSGETATTLTATAGGTWNAGTYVQDAKYLEAGRSYVAIIRYRSLTGDPGWHFAVRPIGVFTLGGNGQYQFDAQLCPLTGDTTGWYVAQFPFTVPSTSLALPLIYCTVPTSGSQIAIDSVNVIPLRDGDYRGAEVAIGGKKFYYGTVPINADFDVGDRILNVSSFGNDQLCTTAGSYGTIGSATLTMGTSTKVGTLSAVDSTYRPGMWLTIPGAGAGGVSAVKKLVYVNGTSVQFNSSTSSTSSVSAVTPTAYNPTFSLLSTSVAAPTVTSGIVAHAGGGQTSATQLVAGWSEVQTVATVADSVKLPVANPATFCAVANGAGNAMQVFTYSAGDYIGSTAGSTGVSIGSISMTTFYCMVTGHWFTK